MEEKIIRPTTKPEAIKGKLLKYQGTDYCEFLPQAQGEPQYEGLVKTRNSQLKRTKGKNPKLLAQIKCNAESVDPYSDMLDELDRLFPESKNLHRNPRGRRLLAACTRGLSSCACSDVIRWLLSCCKRKVVFCSLFGLFFWKQPIFFVTLYSQLRCEYTAGCGSA